MDSPGIMWKCNRGYIELMWNLSENYMEILCVTIDTEKINHGT